MNRYIVAFTVFAAFINPVPSRAEFHPIRWHSDPYDDDVMGSGLELRDCAPLRRVAACDEPMERKLARQWRDLAERVRRLAALSDGEQRDRLLVKAQEFEERDDLPELAISAAGHVNAGRFKIAAPAMEKSQQLLHRHGA
jgi:hypothetical protein